MTRVTSYALNSAGQETAEETSPDDCRNFSWKAKALRDVT